MNHGIRWIEDSRDVRLSFALGVVLLLCLFYVLNLQSALWDPFFGIGGRSVDHSQMHRLGVNSWFYSTETKPFTGIAVKWQDKTRQKKFYEDVFHSGMLHHRNVYLETSNLAIRFDFENEKIVKARFYDKSGAFVSEETQQDQIQKKIRDLGYGPIVGTI